MQSTMQDWPLTITAIMRHGAQVYADCEVVTFTGDAVRRIKYAAAAERMGKLASALHRLGIKRHDRVGTFAWNNQEHLEAYLAVPSMGAVLHALNIRLYPEQLAYVINHAEDRVIIVDDSLIPILARVLPELTTVEHFIVTGDGDASALGPNVLRYEEMLAAEPGDFAWPELEERDAAAMCYTSGTTGNPKGVVYSHRSEFLHALALCSATSFGLSERDRILPIAPMFHANAWGLPYGGWLAGADFVMPDRFLQAEPLCRLIAAERATFAGAVPTIWNDILRFAEKQPVDLSSLRSVVCGGASVPRTLMEQMQERHGVKVYQAWGMTETSPMAAIGYTPRDAEPADEFVWRSKTGRVVHGVELRLMDGERTVDWDGKSIGELQVRGPWITGSYYKDEASADKFHDGWLRTGDIGTVDRKGFMQITDRGKDVIKSGGEWISSVELENAIMSHPHVLEAAVIGVPDPRWDERPLACVVLAADGTATAEDLCGHLESRVAKWWIPERWAFIPQVPKTSVGKFDKKVLRTQREAGQLSVITVD